MNMGSIHCLVDSYSVLENIKIIKIKGRLPLWTLEWLLLHIVASFWLPVKSYKTAQINSSASQTRRSNLSQNCRLMYVLYNPGHSLRIMQYNCRSISEHNEFMFYGSRFTVFNLEQRLIFVR
jgi:hypothetical protein